MPGNYSINLVSPDDGQITLAPGPRCAARVKPSRENETAFACVRQKKKNKKIPIDHKSITDVKLK